MDVSDDAIKRNFHSYLSFLLEKILNKLKQSARVRSEFKEALVNNDTQKVQTIVSEMKRPRHMLNKLLTLSDPPWTFQLPPLCVAIHHKNLDITGCILNNGANPDQQGYASYDSSLTWYLCPLDFIFRDEIEEGWPFQADVAEIMITAGADVNRPISLRREEEEEGGSMEFTTGNTLLHKCILNLQSQAIFDFLVNHGADLLKRNHEEQTPLHIVTSDALFWNAHFANTLIRRGGATSGKDENGCSVVMNLITLMSYAYHSDMMDTLNLLLQVGFVDGNSHSFEQERGALLDLEPVFSATGLHSVYHRLREMIQPCPHQVDSLKHLCRLTIRRTLGPQTLESKLSKLGLPKYLADYLDFRDIGV